MRWKQTRRSENVEDRRGSVPKRAAALGGGGILIVVVAMLFGVDPSKLLGNLQSTSTGTQSEASTYQPTPAERELTEFVAHVLGHTEDVWGRVLPEQAGTDYREPKLVIFRDRVQSACGVQGSSTGPFYCPGDHQVYIDLGFYDTLRQQLGADGDFAQAYVIAHEVGHHIQNLLGKSEEVHRMRSRLSEEGYNDLQVRLELQADFYAGVWAHYAFRDELLERGDIEEAMNAAKMIGDDTLARRAGRVVRPESFTHGSAAQRMKWFRAGLESGDMRQGDTFRARKL